MLLATYIFLSFGCAPARPDYLKYVTDYADAMTTHAVHDNGKGCKLFPTTLDRSNFRLINGNSQTCNYRFDEMLFTIDLKYQTELNSLKLSNSLREDFAKSCFVVDPTSIVEIVYIGEKGPKDSICDPKNYIDSFWRIIDNKNKKTYSIVHQLDTQYLGVYYELIHGFDCGNREVMRLSANPMLDENLYQILIALTKINGNPKYEQTAEEVLKCFFQNCECDGNPDCTTNGLFAWGEHLGWDLTRDKTRYNIDRGFHEYKRPWVLWDLSYQLAGNEVYKFANDIWEYQVGQLSKYRVNVNDIRRICQPLNAYCPDECVPHRTPYFSRHFRCLDSTSIKTTDTTTDIAAYPRHGGFYVATWAGIKRPNLIDHINQLVDYYDSIRFTPSDCRIGTWRFNKGDEVNKGIVINGKVIKVTPEALQSMYFDGIPHDLDDNYKFVPVGILSFVLDLWESANKLENSGYDSTSVKLYASALKTTKVLTRNLYNDPTLVNPILITENYWLDQMTKPNNNPHKLWIDNDRDDISRARIGLMLWGIFEQMRLAHSSNAPPDIADVFKTHALLIADSYCNQSTNDRIGFYRKNTVVPKTLGNVILLMIETYNHTNDSAYLDKAYIYADEAVKLFFTPDSPLPKASNKNEDYEVMTGADTLMMSFLKLWLVKNQPNLVNTLIFTDR